MRLAQDKITKTVSMTAYPATIAFCLILKGIVLRNYPWHVSTYLPVILGAFLVTLLERTCPYKKEWLPNRLDVANDVVFMAVVQVILPKLLSYFVAITLLQFLKSSGTTLSGYWPNDFAPFLQAALMVLTADFLRYWLHRASHEWYLLWRLHAVHHSPHKLYWVNVGRFHPMDKALQFLFDALPFIVLGISEEVLGIYFVFYSINGFFQHCNINLRLGFLNYIISGPELHRWHHSFIITESNRNYGNNLIVWDLLFGTWFLPQAREIDRLGLKNRTYPLDFVSQIGAPFIKGMDKEQP